MSDALEDLEAEARALAQAAERLLTTLPPDRQEGAETVRANAERLASGGATRTDRPSALPLSRPFGEWDYAGPEADAVWDAIGRVERTWDERLGGGTQVP